MGRASIRQWHYAVWRDRAKCFQPWMKEGLWFEKKSALDSGIAIARGRKKKGGTEQG